MSDAVETPSTTADVVDLQLVAEFVDVFRQHGIEPGRLEWGFIRLAEEAITYMRSLLPVLDDTPPA
jgi:hypothetical protein